MDPADFLTEVDEELICGICTSVLLNPMSCKEGHTFCNTCITTWLGQKKTCPMDRKRLGKNDLCTVRVVANLISKMAVRCPNHAAGDTDGGGGPPAKRQKSGKGKAKANESAGVGAGGWLCVDGQVG